MHLSIRFSIWHWDVLEILTNPLYIKLPPFLPLPQFRKGSIETLHPFTKPKITRAMLRNGIRDALHPCTKPKIKRFPFSTGFLDTKHPCVNRNSPFPFYGKLTPPPPPNSRRGTRGTISSGSNHPLKLFPPPLQHGFPASLHQALHQALHQYPILLPPPHGHLQQEMH